MAGGALALTRRGLPPGEAPSVVLVHGGTSSAAVDWDPVLPWLETAFDVVTMDLRGHGASTGLEGGIGIEAFAADLELVLEELGLRGAGLVGCSVGGHSILSLAARRPELAGAVVTIGACRRGDPSRIRTISEGRWLPELMAIEHDQARTWSGEGPYWRHLLEVLTIDWAEHHDILDEDLAAVRCPTLVVHGDRDKVQPPSEAITIAAGLPDSELFVVPGAGHMAQVHRPDLVGPALVAFVADRLGQTDFRRGCVRPEWRRAGRGNAPEGPGPSG